MLALVSALCLVVLWWAGIVLLFTDLDSLLSAPRSLSPLAAVSPLLDVLTCALAFFLIYQILDNAFSCEMRILENGFILHMNATEIAVEWKQIDSIRMEKAFGRWEFHYVWLREPREIFSKEPFRKLFFWIKTKTILLSVFEDGAANVIQGKLGR